MSQRTLEAIEQFHQKNLHSLWQEIRFYFLIRKVYRENRKAIWQAHLDLLFIQQYQFDELTLNETPVRTELQKLKVGVPEEKRDQNAISKLEDQIARSKTVKENYRKTEEIINDMERYQSMIELWLS